MKPVESLRSSLYLAAKADRNRRFHSLHDKICRMDVLWESWRRVKENKGAAGTDSQTIDDIEREGVEPFLTQLQGELRAGTYEVGCVRRVFIPKRDGKKKMRPLGVPTVRERVVQQAVKLVVEPIFEADFQEFSYGYRPNKSAKEASLQVRDLIGNEGLTNVLDIDIEGFFDHINHDKLLSFLMERVTDPYIVKLVREWLHAGVVYLGSVNYPEEGTPQGGVISPLLANIYLNKLDAWWVELGMDRAYNARMVRYADDVVILTDSEEMNHIMDVFEGLLSELDLSLSTEKTRMTSAEDGFDFLSFRFVRRYHPKRGKVLTHFFPSRGALMRFKEKVRFMAVRRFSGAKDERQLAKELNLFMTGWSNYFNHSNAGMAYTRLQEFVEWKFRKFICFRHKITRLAASHNGYREPRSYGLMRLSGRISRTSSWMKSNATRRSTSDSRMSEKFTSG